MQRIDVGWVCGGSVKWWNEPIFICCSFCFFCIREGGEYPYNLKIIVQRTCSHEVDGALLNTVHNIVHNSFHCIDIDPIPLNGTNIGLLFFRSESLSQCCLRFGVHSFTRCGRRRYRLQGLDGTGEYMRCFECRENRDYSSACVTDGNKVSNRFDKNLSRIENIGLEGLTDNRNLLLFSSHLDLTRIRHWEPRQQQQDLLQLHLHQLCSF